MAGAVSLHAAGVFLGIKADLGAKPQGGNARFLDLVVFRVLQAADQGRPDRAAGNRGTDAGGGHVAGCGAQPIGMLTGAAYFLLMAGNRRKTLLLFGQLGIGGGDIAA